MKTFKAFKYPNEKSWWSVDVTPTVGDDPVDQVECVLPVGEGALTKLSERTVGNTYFIKLADGVVGSYILKLKIWTVGGQEFERSVKLKVKEG